MYYMLFGLNCCNIKMCNKKTKIEFMLQQRKIEYCNVMYSTK